MRCDGGLEESCGDGAQSGHRLQLQILTPALMPRDNMVLIYRPSPFVSIYRFQEFSS